MIYTHAQAGHNLLPHFSSFEVPFMLAVLVIALLRGAGSALSAVLLDRICLQVCILLSYPSESVSIPPPPSVISDRFAPLFFTQYLLQGLSLGICGDGEIVVIASDGICVPLEVAFGIAQPRTRLPHHL